MCKDCTAYSARPGVTRPAESPDYADGGVAAALIEKEAERKARGTATDSALARYWLKEYDRAEARAEKAEDRADDAHNLIVALRADLAATEARAEQAETMRDEAKYSAEVAKHQRDNWESVARQALAEQPRPLIPDAITDEMRERARAAFFNEWNKAGSRTSDAVNAALTAALTDPPARPEGAEDIEAAIREVTPSRPGDRYADLADKLAERGVRVVSEEQS